MTKQFIITSLLDTDLYKLTMQQAVFHQFPQANDVEYRFKCRNQNINLSQYKTQIEEEIKHFCTLRFTEEELQYLSSLRYFKPDFIDFLYLYQPREKYISVIETENNEIDIIIRGPWLHTILFEVPILAIVNEVYFKKTQNENTFEIGKNNLANKISMIKNFNQSDFKFSEFGTRRRYSKEWQDYVISELVKNVPENMGGTSNVYFAKKYNITPIGTMAHEYLQACQALGPRLVDSQKFALEKWVQEYRGDLGIALTDVIGIDAFQKDFDLYFCKLFDGVRHDSGSPYTWADKMLSHYQKMKIDPKTKSFVFSDGLDFQKSFDLFNTYQDKAKLFFGIGTNLTNDLGQKALNIVIKMVSCNGQPVAKISDEPSKSMCKDDTYLNYLKQTFSVP